MADIELKKELRDNNPISGEVENNNTLIKKELKKENMTEKEKEIIEERENNKLKQFNEGKISKGRVEIQLGNIDLVKIKLLELQNHKLEAIMRQMIEMNYYLKKSLNLDDEALEDLQKLEKTKEIAGINNG